MLWIYSYADIHLDSPLKSLALRDPQIPGKSLDEIQELLDDLKRNC